MNEQDQKTRRQWLGVWVIVTISNVIFMLMHLYNDPSFASFPQALQVTVGLFLVLTAAFSFIFWHCAYRKPGMKLLLFSIWTTGLSVLITPILYTAHKLTLPSFMPNYGVYLLYSEGVGILWMGMCIRLRKVNQKLQALLPSKA